MFIYPIYNHNWRNISTIYIYKKRQASNEIFPMFGGKNISFDASLVIYVYK